MKIIIWIISLFILNYFGKPEIAFVVFMVGLVVGFIWLMIVSQSEEIILEEGVYVNNISQEKGKTIITLSNGAKQLFNSSNVSVLGNKIIIN